MAGIILCSTGRSCDRGNRKTESVTYPFKKKSHGIRSILVGSKAAPGLLQHVWVEMDYWLSICHVTWDRYTDPLRGVKKKKREFSFPSVGHMLIYWYILLTAVGFNPLNTKLNPTCHLLALLGAHHIFHVSSVRVNTKHWIFRLSLTAFCFVIILL